MGSGNHIISKQVFEIELSGISEGGQVVQSEITNMYYDQMLPAIERVLDKVCADGEIIRIDKLVIDVGSINHSRLESQFTEAVVEKLNSRLNELMFARKHENQLDLNRPIKNNSVQGEMPDVVTIEESFLSAVLFFLDTGNMPWFYSSKNRESQSPGQLMLKLLDTKDDKVFLPLVKKLEQDIPFRRFVYQLTDKEIYQLFEKAEKLSFNTLSQRKNVLKLAAFSLGLLTVFQKLQIAELTSNSWRLKLWQIPISLLFHYPQRVKETPSMLKQQIINLLELVAYESSQIRNKSADIEETATKCMKVLSSSKVANDHALITILSEFVNRKQSWKTDTDKYSSKPEKHKTTDDESLLSPSETESNVVKTNTEPEQLAASSSDKSPDSTDNKSATLAKDNAQNAVSEEKTKGANSQKLETEENDSSRRAKSLSKSEIDLKDKKPLADPNKLNPINESEAYYIGNAGMVILHPYIRIFFEKLGLLHNKEFLSKDARQKAVHLLQYLTTGKSETSEEQLTLNKLLCGIVTNEPILRGIDVAYEEKEECKKLLEHVIAQWSVLKKTSPEALRQTFLQREGVIHKDRDNFGWKLTVKRTTMDLLLDKLPWGISIIKMPWNPYLIHVEW